jgi:membrane-bound lytic murein transglycosylase D
MFKSKNILLLVPVLLASLCGVAQPAATSAEEERIVAALDSLYNAFHAHRTDKRTAGDLNIYGFNELDVPQYSDSVIKYRLSLLESPIAMDYNEHVQGFINLYAIRKRNLTSKVLALSKYYFPMFEQILDQQKLPLEFKYLAVIESALNPRAVSVASANGLWQFINSTGKMYGLKINTLVDERRDPYKSTLAACQYFKDSYALYGDWLLVIASYNCGPGNVNKAIRRSGGKMNFWEIMPYLPKETRGYVPAFIAATYVLSYATEHNIYPMELDIKLNVDTIHISNSTTFQKLSQITGLELSIIEDLNPAYKKGVIPWYQGSAAIVLPYEYAMKYASYRANPAGFIPATGDSVPSDVIFDDDLIVNTPPPEQPDRTAVNKPQKKKVHVVQRGDGLFKISRKFNVTVEDIRKWNNLKNDKLVPGQKLNIYPTTQAPRRNGNN